MKFFWSFSLATAVVALNVSAAPTDAAGPEPKIPRFSIDYMDRAISPGSNFYEFAAGTWVRDNPVPADKSRWGSFSELQERNSYLIHGLLEAAAADTSGSAHTPRREVGDFFASAMDTNRIEQLGLKPIAADLKRIDNIKSTKDIFPVLAAFHQEGIGGIFGAGVGPDARDSSIYAFEVRQGGLSLPDRDYYLKDSFAPQRKAYLEHVTRMFTLLGQNPGDAAANAGIVLDLETALANVSRSRVELRDPIKNYNKFVTANVIARYPAMEWKLYLADSGLATVPYAIVGQPEYFDAVNQLIKERPLYDWKTYLRWHVLHTSAPFLPRDVELENFNFFGKTLTGQPEEEPRWKRVSRVIDGSIGEALGQLYVEKYFPPEARARMDALVENLKTVFADHLQKVPWMSEETKAKAQAKFARFTQKIGYPDKFRDYSTVKIERDDYLGNVRRAAAFEDHREVVRVGKPVDRTEWFMTPPTVNAYFDPPMNEIVFPAGILQPPFFDVTMDDAVNYGAIGVVIGHEITHGYDDQGRKYDADGNLNDWWTPQDAQEFNARAQKVVDEYNAFEALPGLHVNGRLTLGENLADLGGVSIAFDAMERALAKDPSQRKDVDGFTPEQRFFISFAQIWRTNTREAELRRLVTVDPHSPGQFRAVGPIVNYQQFFDAFGIHEGDPMWRAPDLRAKIW